MFDRHSLDGHNLVDGLAVGHDGAAVLAVLGVAVVAGRGQLAQALHWRARGLEEEGVDGEPRDAEDGGQCDDPADHVGRQRELVPCFRNGEINQKLHQDVIIWAKA